ncbi:hypothetical protein TWF696_005566 [Orbilia brochopaga]|uniref:Uncharacterized protein n=1 Tax=Orbilia brochopaga TaxID=3140254 RepID=A0AAV9V2T5_9PEZI
MSDRSQLSEAFSPSRSPGMQQQRTTDSATAITRARAPTALQPAVAHSLQMHLMQGTPMAGINVSLVPTNSSPTPSAPDEYFTESPISSSPPLPILISCPSEYTHSSTEYIHSSTESAQVSRQVSPLSDQPIHSGSSDFTADNSALQEPLGYTSELPILSESLENQDLSAIIAFPGAIDSPASTSNGRPPPDCSDMARKKAPNSKPHSQKSTKASNSKSHKGKSTQASDAGKRNNNPVSASELPLDTVYEIIKDYKENGPDALFLLQEELDNMSDGELRMHWNKARVDLEQAKLEQLQETNQSETQCEGRKDKNISDMLSSGDSSPLTYISDSEISMQFKLTQNDASEAMDSNEMDIDSTPPDRRGPRSAFTLNEAYSKGIEQPTPGQCDGGFSSVDSSQPSYLSHSQGNHESSTATVQDENHASPEPPRALFILNIVHTTSQETAHEKIYFTSLQRLKEYAEKLAPTVAQALGITALPDTIRTTKPILSKPGWQRSIYNIDLPDGMRMSQQDWERYGITVDDPNLDSNGRSGSQIRVMHDYIYRSGNDGMETGEGLEDAADDPGGFERWESWVQVAEVLS